MIFAFDVTYDVERFFEGFLAVLFAWCHSVGDMSGSIYHATPPPPQVAGGSTAAATAAAPSPAASANGGTNGSTNGSAASANPFQHPTQWPAAALIATPIAAVNKLFTLLPANVARLNPVFYPTGANAVPRDWGVPALFTDKLGLKSIESTALVRGWLFCMAVRWG